MSNSKLFTCFAACGVLAASVAVAESTVNIREVCFGNLDRIPTIGFRAYTLPDTVPVNATSIGFADGDEGYIQICDLPVGQTYLLQIIPDFNQLTGIDKNVKIYHAKDYDTTSFVNMPSIITEYTVPADTTGTITLNATLRL